MKSLTITLVLALSSLGQAKNNLNIAINAEADTLNPIITSMMASIYVIDATNRPLVKLTKSGKAEAVLIEAIPEVKNKLVKIIEKPNAKPSMVAKIKFRKDAQWADGVPITCADLEASWKIGMGDKVSNPNKEEFSNIQKIEFTAANPKDCTITYNEARWDFHLNFPRLVPAHIELPIYEKHKNEAQAYERNSQYVTNVSNPGLYNGPYKVQEFKTGSHIMLSKNEKFWGKKAEIEKIIFKFILNTSTMEANLVSKNIDLISSSGLGFDQALSLEKKIQQDKLPYQIIFEPGVVYAHIDLNLDNPILSDLKVRKALAISFNRDDLTKAFFQGKQKPALHFSTELDSWYTEDPKEISINKYDPKLAAKLLDDAGWKPADDGYRTKDGKRLQFNISSSADIKINEMIQTYLQGAWKKIGVDLQIKNYPARVLFGEIIKKRNFDLAFYSFVNNPDSNPKSTYHSQAIPSQENSWSGSNRPGWKNKSVDELLEKVDTEFDPKKRTALIKKVLKHYTEDIPALPMYYKSNTSVYPINLKNYWISPHTFSEYLEVENWSLQ
jgi:peptide/nickel transport system substrate-binding protein